MSASDQTKQEISVRGTELVVYAYWSIEATSQLQSIEIVQEVDTEEVHDEDIITIKPEGLESLVSVLRRLVGDMRMQRNTKKRRLKNELR